MSALGDASDTLSTLHTRPRLHGWTVEQWIEYLQRTPESTLPGGVGGAIVKHYEASKTPFMWVVLTSRDILTAPDDYLESQEQAADHARLRDKRVPVDAPHSILALYR